MLNRPLAKFQNACDLCSGGWLLSNSNDLAALEYKTKDSDFGFKIQITEARVHLFVMLADVRTPKAWPILIEQIIRQQENWRPLETVLWNADSVLSVSKCGCNTSCRQDLKD